MPWLRIDDTAQDDPKVLRCGFEVFGFVALCAAWAAGKVGKIDDGFVPEAMAMRIAGTRWEEMSKAAIKAGLFSKPTRSAFGDRGWLIDQSDELLHMRTWLEVKTDREKDKATRQSGAKADVRLRDGDQCRYCSRTVNWNDRRGTRGGTYDHPDPADRDTFVVACGGCNRSKKDRTVAEWEAAGGMPLLPPPDRPLIGPVTAEQFGVPVTDPSAVPARTTTSGPQPPCASPQGTAADRARPDQVEDAAPGSASPTGTAAAPTAGPGSDLDLSNPESHTYRSRDGSGTGRDRDGSGSPGSSPPPDVSRKRGSRGGKARRRTTPTSLAEQEN